MKALSQPIVGVTIAVLLTAIATSPSNAARCVDRNCTSNCTTSHSSISSFTCQRSPLFF